MKILKKVALVISIFTATNMFGQDIIDANGDKVAELESSGILYDGDHVQVGKFLENGGIVNAEGLEIGSIEGYDFKDPMGTVLGRIDANNNVFDLNNSKIGSVQAGLMVIDANNHVLGRASSSIEATRLVAYFFFFFNNGLM